MIVGLLQAARAHAADMEEQAQEETVGAEEAYLLLGDAEVTVSHPTSFDMHFSLICEQIGAATV